MCGIRIKESKNKRNKDKKIYTKRNNTASDK